MKKTTLIMDLQFGSTGKGLYAHWLAEINKPTAVMSQFGPNAGHTSYLDGVKFVHTMLPMAMLVDSVKQVFIGPGSVINIDSLKAELAYAANYLDHMPEILIHENAAFVMDVDRDTEQRMVHIGSTMKGTMDAVIRKMERSAADVIGIYSGTEFLSEYKCVIVKAREWAESVSIHDNIQIEGAQGYGLSIHHGFYPYVTSRDVSAHQILADVGYPRGMATPEVHGTCRTYPIRVANRYDDDGNQIGYSGPGWPGQRELEWSDLGVEPEITTVTKLPRRVFEWSWDQVTEAIFMNGVDYVFLNFTNYPGNHDKKIEDILLMGAKLIALGHGPEPHNIELVDGHYK